MFKIIPDLRRPGKFKMTYYPFSDVKEFLYEMENLEWDSIRDHIKDTLKDSEDLYWIHDIMRLSNKSVALLDSGDWTAF
jgi:hypothetical protein